MKKDKKLYELYGILMGDGCISKYISSSKVHYEFRIDGNATTDFDYYHDYVVSLIEGVTGRRPKPRLRKDCHGIYITFHYKEFAFFLREHFNFPFGKKGSITIENSVYNDFNKLKHFLRGLFDTDGSLYFTKNNSEKRYYPIIEISTYSPPLLKQLKEALTRAGFSVKISHYKKSVKLHGKENLLKWMSVIGTSNQDKASKFAFWSKHGYCPKIDELNYKERLKLLGL